MSEGKTIKIPPVITVKDFAQRLEKSASDVIRVLLENGFLANINETIDFETAALIAGEFDAEVELEKIDEAKTDVLTPEQLAEIIHQEQESGINLKDRPAIVTILGHVDHGKTTLLDTIRKTNVAQGEAGGITQHITAYQVKVKNRTITFIDTPGHEAFSKMRERGADVADIAILIVAADDGVKPQTKEVIENLKKGRVPMVVAINKIDKPEANAEKVKGQLAEMGILLEKRGGNVPCVEISAKNNLNIDELLETIILVADVIKISANHERKALGIILESHLDERKGVVATAIIKTGTLEEGDSIIAGSSFGTARQILDYTGKRILKAAPGSPITIIGFDNVCKAGSVLQTEESKTSAKEKTKRFIMRLGEKVEEQKASFKRIDDQQKNEQKSELNLILKADAEGSLEAIRQILDALPQDEVSLNVLSQRVGNVTETDIQLAATSKAFIYGFKNMVPALLERAAKKNKTEVRIFDVIYKLVDDIKNEMSALLPPEIIRTELGEMSVLAIFRTDKTSMIVGGRITSGKVSKGSRLEIWRAGQLMGTGKVTQVKHNQDILEEVKEGTECGITYVPEGSFHKIQTGDTLKFYREEKKMRKIS